MLPGGISSLPLWNLENVCEGQTGQVSFHTVKMTKLQLFLHCFLFGFIKH